MGKSAQQMATNWQNAMGSPTTAQNYKLGIQGTTVNPMALAASPQAQQLYLQNTAAAVNSGKMANKLTAVPIDRWKSNALNVGASLLTSGASKAKDKVASHFQKWQPIYQQASDAANALPKGGMANAMARVQANLSVLMAAAGRS